MDDWLADIEYEEEEVANSPKARESCGQPTYENDEFEDFDEDSFFNDDIVLSQD